MEASFIPVRAFFGRQLLLGRCPSQLSSHRYGICTTSAKLSARERRREVDHVRRNVHKEVKRELENRADELVRTIVSVPNYVRERCALTSRVARVKVHLEKDDLLDISTLKGSVRSGLVRLYPELEQRKLLRVSDDFDIRICGGSVVQDTIALEKGLQRCEHAGSDVFIEVVPHNTPPARAPLSERVQAVKEKALAASQDPNLNIHMISFYKFINISRPDIVSDCLLKTWGWMGVKGRIYVAKEGVNAQLAVPDVVISDFKDAMDGSWLERGEPVIPLELVGVFLNVDRVVHRSEQPFEKLNVRAREKVLADGFQKSLDWNKAGKEVSAEEWHRLVQEQSDDVILLDCRNKYESDVGRFEGAEPLNTQTFRESWDHLEKRLEHEDRNKKILTYCTGGIRCVKVNAFLEQKMGFSNTGRLEGGIVSYVRKLREMDQIKESAFKGVNHVFDGRMGEVITDDLLDRCLNCNQPCNVQTDCGNVECPRPFDSRMFVQCEECATRMNGACSKECQEVMYRKGVVHETSSPVRKTNVGSKEDVVRNDSNEYAEYFSTQERPLLQELRERTRAEFPGRWHMMSSHVQASLLRFLIEICGGTRVLEIGTFTGYATLAMASALPSEGRVVTFELDKTVAKVAKEFFERDSEHGHKIEMHIGKAQNSLRKLESEKGFNLAFIDADKGGYRSYTEFVLEHDIIEKGGILVFDNVLFRNEVAQIWKEERAVSESGFDGTEMVQKRLQNINNVRRTAQRLHAFNKFLANESRLEQVILPFRDGLTIARKLC